MTTSRSRSISLIKQIELLFRGKALRVAKQRPARAQRQQRRAANDEFLYRTWTNLRNEYFPDRAELDSYTISWSSRSQKRVLASCNIRRRHVVVARELFEPSACRWIQAVLYHELCHAVIGEGVRTQGGKRQWHGPEFRALEARHPDIEPMNIWIRTGGWAMAVRSNRSRRAWAARKVAS